MSTTGTTPETPSITVHGKTYNLPPPDQPVVVICIDGFDPSYLDSPLAAPLPNLSSFPFRAVNDARAAMPTFTNPNNVSIITGQPTAVHGISGNYYLDGETGEEHMVVDDSTLRGGSTILAEIANYYNNKSEEEGGGYYDDDDDDDDDDKKKKKKSCRVAAVTAKDKLRKILQHGLPLSSSSSSSSFQPDNDNGSSSLSFSAEKASDEIVRWVGAKGRPSQYSADLSLFVLDAGLKILKEKRAEVLYLTLSDYVQHKHAPGEEEADEFMSAVDEKIGEMIERYGAIVAVTGDHGMSDKCCDEGEEKEGRGKEEGQKKKKMMPNVVFLQDELEREFGGRGYGVRVICPITDPFVRHHGALGGFVRVHIKDDDDDAEKKEKEGDDGVVGRKENLVGEMVEFCKGLEMVEEAWPREEAARRYETPADLEGDLVVVSKGNAVLGARESEHDLSNIDDHGLRSHGGLSEQKVPLLMSVPFVSREGGEHRRDWRNFDIFDLVLNHSR